MTSTNKTLKNYKNNNQDEAMKLLNEINNKLDYLIKLLREEEYKYPFHSSYNDTYESKK
jgi:hypothetical protein